MDYEMKETYRYALVSLADLAASQVGPSSDEENFQVFIEYLNMATQIVKGADPKFDKFVKGMAEERKADCSPSGEGW